MGRVWAPAWLRAATVASWFRFWIPQIVVVVLICCSSASAAAQSASAADELARRHFESGAAYLEESDYENALRAFQKSFELSKRPEILLNIATVEERRGQIAAAISALKQYLAAAPKGQHADTAQLRIQNLEKRLPPTEPKPEAPPVPEPSKAPDQPEAAPEAPVVIADPPAPVRRTKRRPTAAYVSLGVGVATLVGAVVTGVLAKGEYDDAKATCNPSCADSRLETGRNLALTSTILTAVGVVASGIGVTLLIVDSRPSTGAATRTELAVAPLPGGAAARASWRF